jgi:hypothetical protein
MVSKYHNRATLVAVDQRIALLEVSLEGTSSAETFVEGTYDHGIHCVLYSRRQKLQFLVYIHIPNTVVLYLYLLLGLQVPIHSFPAQRVHVSRRVSIQGKVAASSQ